MSLKDDSETYQQLIDTIPNPPEHEEESIEGYKLLKHRSKECVEGKDIEVDITNELHELAVILNRALLQNTTWSDQTIARLADATTDSAFWRSRFGLLSKPSKETNIEQHSETSEPDCLLEVVRRVVNQGWKSETSSRFRSSLRLIANCCADNNINRSVIVWRHGIDALLSAAGCYHEVNLIIPTLYNVCVDFDEPAFEGPERAPDSSSGRSSQNELNEEMSLTVSEQKLGRFKQAPSGEPVIQLLLNLYEHTSVGQFPYIAELIEMASRLCGRDIDQLVRVGDSPATRQDYVELMNSLTAQGTQLVLKSFESCVSICQTMLNVLSKDQARTALLMSKDGVDLFVRLPFIGVEEDEDNDLIAFQTEFLKLIYQISALPDYQTANDLQSALTSTCIENLQKYRIDAEMRDDSDVVLRNPSQLACYCVLLANIIDSENRAVQLSKIPGLFVGLNFVISHTNDNALLLPAVNLLTRLVMSRTGQDVSYEADIASSIRQMMVSRDLTLDVQRESIALVRLMIKGRPEHLSILKERKAANEQNFEEVGLLDSIMNLFVRTIDASSKIETGRLVVEIYRGLLDVAHQQKCMPEDFEAQLIHLFENSNNSIDPVIFLIRESQSSTLISEGWFGLAVLSIWAWGRSLILKAIMMYDMINLMHDIAQSREGPDRNNLKLLLAKIRLVPSGEIPHAIQSQIESVSIQLGLVSVSD